MTPLMTDAEYIINRDRLIPEAERYANRLFLEHNTEEWTKCFLRKMDDLAIAAGLVVKGIY